MKEALQYSTGNQIENTTFTMGFLGREPHDMGFYDSNYFKGKKADQGIQFAPNGAYLNPESEYRHKFQALLFWIGEHVKEGKILDVGAGPGHLAYWAKRTRKPYQIWSCDISLPILQSEYNNNSVRSMCSTAFQLPFANEKFQAVVFSDILEHLLPQQAVQAIKEAHRLLDDKGYIFVKIPNRIIWNQDAQKDEGHVWLPTNNEVIKMLVLGGFKREGIQIFTKGFPFSSIFKKITNHDIKLPLYGKNIHACVRK